MTPPGEGLRARSSAWGGLVPSDAVPADARGSAPEGGAGGVDTAPPAPHVSHQDRALDRMALMHGELAELVTAARLAQLAGDRQLFEVTVPAAKAAPPVVTDSYGLSPCASYAIFNTAPFTVWISFDGSPPVKGSGAIPVATNKLVVFPFEVARPVLIAGEAAEAEAKGFIQRVRFPTPQAAFVGALV